MNYKLQKKFVNALINKIGARWDFYDKQDDVMYLTEYVAYRNSFSDPWIQYHEVIESLNNFIVSRTQLYTWIITITKKYDANIFSVKKI